MRSNGDANDGNSHRAVDEECTEDDDAEQDRAGRPDHLQGL